MTLFQSSLIATAFLCSLVAGLLSAFAIVVMPGIGSLNDKDYVRAFQVIDRVIQNNQPLFMLLWVGSLVTLAIATWLSLPVLDGARQGLMFTAAGLYLLGVQLPTAAIHLPLNNALQAVDVDGLTEPMLNDARVRFERRWNRWNRIRTACASLTSLILLVLLSMAA